MSDFRRVTVSIVSHRQSALLPPLLDSLAQYCQEHIETVLLTHNVLGDALSAAHYPLPVQPLFNRRPQGFGANHNRAFHSCRTPWFLVLNPDVRFTSDAVGALLQRATPQTGLLAPGEVDAQGNDHTELRGAVTPGELWRRHVLHRPDIAPKRGGWVRGMFMLIRSDVFAQLHGFDEGYRLYCEDFDLCARIMLAGYDVRQHADIKIIHDWQRHSRRSPLSTLRHVRSLQRMWHSPIWEQYRATFENDTA